MQNYFEDKTHVSHSMLCDFVSYDKFGGRTVTPEYYYAKHVGGGIKFEPTDAMVVGTIVDRYFAEGPQVLEEYPAVSRRSGKDPKEITNGMSESVARMIGSLDQFKTFQEFANDPITICGNSEGCVLTGTFGTGNGQMKLKGKVDFINHCERMIVDLKTTASIDMVMSDMRFRGTPNVFARYIRQGAYYRNLAGEGYSFALAIVDDNGKFVYVPIRQDILDAAWSHVSADLTQLASFYDDGWKNLIVDPFGPLKEEVSEDDTL